MKTKLLLAAGALILFKSISVPAAGGWTSGGGELIRDQHNPWFIQNTKQVNYCILINEKEFGQSKEFVARQIEKSILFWKTNLKDLQYSSIAGVANSSENMILVGTQDFHEVSCDGAHDIAFQFGILTDEQKRRMGDTSKIVGISIRTDYDMKSLKAKGFIYLPKDSQFVSRPWSTDAGMRVLPVLIHEMGHVFGLQHNTGVQYMSEDYPASLIDSKGNFLFDIMLKELNESDLAKTHIFRYVPNMSPIFAAACGGEVSPLPLLSKKNPKPVQDVAPLMRKFFNLKDDETCFHYEIYGDELRAYAGNKIERIGQAKLIDTRPLVEVKTAVLEFWFPKEQLVFANLPDWAESMKIPFGLYQPKIQFKGEYKSLDGKTKRKIALKLNTYGGIEAMSGVLDGEIYINLGSGI